MHNFNTSPCFSLESSKFINIQQTYFLRSFSAEDKILPSYSNSVVSYNSAFLCCYVPPAIFDNVQQTSLLINFFGLVNKICAK
jgi:hypothetical protein